MITCLEKQGMSLASSISIVEDTKLKLTQIDGAQSKNKNRNCIREN